MTAARQSRARRVTVALTRAQVESILIDIGFEHEDVSSFWRMARQETRDPGCLARSRTKYIAKCLRLSAD